MTSIEGKAVERIGNAIVELEHVISSLQHAAIGRRASLLEPDNPNGLEPTLRIYSFAFRHPDCPKMLPEEGLSVMSKLKDCWDRFFNGLTSICDNRELCRKAEEAQHDVHLAATNALLGKHAENETTLLENFRNVLTSIAGDVADKDQKFPKYDSEGRPLVAVDAITKKGETALKKTLSNITAKIKGKGRGKGSSHSSHIGDRLNGVQLKEDGQHITIDGTEFKITSKKIWEFLDCVINAHFADKPAQYNYSIVNSMTSKEAKKISQRLDWEEIPPTQRKGNQRYTGRVRFKLQDPQKRPKW